ncbi:MAG: transcription factor S [Candidatus Woesearchaeota archaeon]
MQFCPNCQSILIPKKGYFICSCGYKKKIDDNDEKIVIKEKIEHKEIEIIDEENEHIGDDVLPIKCWNCGNEGVYFWMVQMRRADEPPTRFYKCKKCKKVWRSGK